MNGNKILVIDPDVASRNFVTSALRQQQFSVTQVGTGKEGLITAWRDRPDLIIVEPALPDLSGEELAARLRQDPRTERVPLLALSADNRPVRSKACLEAGFSEFIPKTGQAIPAMLAAVDKLLNRVVEAPPWMAATLRKGFSIVFLSAKGGIGTSSVCANLAMHLGQNQPDDLVALVDLVLPIGSLAPIVGCEQAENLVTLADKDLEQEGSDLIARHLCTVNLWHLSLLAGCPDPESASRLRVEHIGGIVDQLKAAFDYVLMDVGRSLSRITLPLIQQADLVVLVVGTDLSSIANTRTVLDYLHSKGVANASIFTILNRAVGLEGLTRAEAEKVLAHEIPLAIPYLPYFALANNQHQPFTVKFPNDTAAFVFKDAAEKMLEMTRQVRASKEHS